eukprot:COSAG01_NODE_286_length_19421_cov_123.895663_15_plen_37_part_00
MLECVLDLFHLTRSTAELLVNFWVLDILGLTCAPRT